MIGDVLLDFCFSALNTGKAYFISLRNLKNFLSSGQSFYRIFCV